MIKFENVKNTIPRLSRYLTTDEALVSAYKKEEIFDLKADTLVNRLNIDIRFSKRSYAAYYHFTDVVRMPSKWYFDCMPGLSRKKNYYITLFHEITHWTGRSNRLNRSTLTCYGSGKILKIIEEVTAELCANMLMDFFEMQKRPAISSLAQINNELEKINDEYQEDVYIRSEEQAAIAFCYLMNFL